MMIDMNKTQKPRRQNEVNPIRQRHNIRVNNIGLTDKQKAYADRRIAFPKESMTQSALAVYNTDNRRSATQVALANENNPKVIDYLAKHSSTIEQMIIDNTYKLLNGKTLEELQEGLKNGRWIHDKVHGKALQKTETVSTHLKVTLDLSGNTQPKPIKQSVTDHNQ